MDGVAARRKMPQLEAEAATPAERARLDEAYKWGYQDGESDCSADWEIALDGLVEDPTPTNVAALLEKLLGSTAQGVDLRTPEQIAEAAADEATFEEHENVGLAFVTARLVVQRLREAGHLPTEDAAVQGVDLR